MKYPDDYINKIICGDCLDVMKGIPDKSIDLVLTDPPYGIERFKNVEKETSGCFAKRGTFKNASQWNNLKPDERHWQEIFRISKNQIIWGGNNFTLPNTEYFIIWDKKQAMPNFARCEYAWVSMGLKSPAKIFEYSINKVNHSERFHPTSKPVKLFKWIIKEYSKEIDIILDPFMGSGTTAVACKELGRRYIGIEISEKYCEIARKRLENIPERLF
ncbi:MAG: DNA methyltransferase [Candidatus Omnitrophica bacterium]|nr:DNA methyltransferase [Candidatus Omnitrophota bacterium]MDD5589118.1 DNA methyltransferase [Candidatus Nanoarchaeia archaeon]